MYTILLVDDEPILLRAAMGFLGKYADFRCDACPSGKEALEMISAAHYDVVVSDYEMPGMSGIELLKAIREQHPELPFILFTGRGREEVAIEALNNGADFYVQKGGDIESQFADLAHKIRHGAEKTQRTRRLQHLNQALLEEKERLKVTLRSIGDGVIVTDTEGRVVSLNRVAEELCGWKSEEAAGRPLTDVFHIINEKTGAACANPVQKVLESGRIVGLANHTALISRKGTKKAIADSAAPIRDAEGAILGVVLVFRDVTAEKEAEHEHLWLAAIAGSSADAIFAVTPEGIIATWNSGAERIYGYTAAEVIGRHISTLAPRELASENIDLMAQVMEGTLVEQYETYRYRKGGERIDVTLTISPLIDADGEFIGFSGISRDITVRKQYEQRIEHLNRVLLAIRNVNQIIVEETETSTLLQKICDLLTETGGYHNAWIALYDESGRLAVRAEAGLGERLKPLDDLFGRGSMTRCARNALDSAGSIITDDPASICSDCPLSPMYEGRGAMTARIEHGDSLYGLLSLSVPRELVFDEEERALFEEVAADIGLALHGIGLEEERATAERALAGKKERLRVTLQSIGDGVIVTDTEGLVVSLNPVAEDLCGWKSEEAAGQPLTDVFHIINEKTRRVCANPVEKVLESGRIVGLANHTALISRNGEERAIADSAAPIRDAGGEILGVVLVFRDVTEEKEAEREHLWLGAIAGSSVDAIYTVTPEGIIATWNRGAERIYGYTAAEAIGRHVSAMAPPELAHEGIDLMAKVMDGALVEQYETYRYRKGGERIDITLTISPLIDADGEFLGFSGISRDITERKQHEQQIEHLNRTLTEEKERLRVTLHSIGDGVIVTDTEGMVVSLNPVAEDLCGWKSEEAAGQPLTDVFHIINEKTRRVCANPVEKVLESGRIVGLANHTALISRNGEERAIADSAAPIRDAGGAILGVVLVFRDVTAEKQTEMERLRLAAIAESSENAIFDASPDGIILTWNRGAERMTGYSANEIIGKNISLLTPPDRKTESLENIERVKREGCVLQLETARVRKDGSLIDINATILPFLDEDGDYTGFSGIIQDLTEKKEAEKRIDHINRVLLAIRNVNQLITQVRDEETLLREVCTTLIETRGFHSAWIALFDEAGNCTRAVEAGVGNSFAPMAERLSRGELTQCRRRVLEAPAVIVTRDPAATCGDCPIASHYRGRAAMARRLEGNGRVYGLLSISLPREMADDEEEQALFEEVASDIGFALHTYEIEHDRIRAEKALFEANTKLNLLSSITRHDIINQTTGISAMMHLLNEELEGNPNAQEYCAYMQEALDTINRQIFFTRDYQDMGVKQPEWHKVAAVIERAAKTTITNGISLDNQAGPLEIYADPMVERVFFNLLDNAVRHGSEVGTIRVSSTTGGDGCTIILEDDGAGIPAIDKEAIFERGVGKNTGYGLFLARAILDITGISIRETGEEGKGARFEIEVPTGQWRTG